MKTQFKIRGKIRVEGRLAGSKKAAWSLLKVQCSWSRKSWRWVLCCVLYACWQLLWLAFAVALLAAFRRLQSEQEWPGLQAVKLVRQPTQSNSALHFSKWHEVFTFSYHAGIKLSDFKLWWYISFLVCFFFSFKVEPTFKMFLLLCNGIWHLCTTDRGTSQPCSLIQDVCFQHTALVI